MIMAPMIIQQPAPGHWADLGRRTVADRSKIPQNQGPPSRTAQCRRAV